MKGQPTSQLQPSQPGIESKIHATAESDVIQLIGTGKLRNKVAIIAFGKGKVSHSVAVAFANENADIVLLYHDKDLEVERIQRDVEAMGRSCLMLAGDIDTEDFCIRSINAVLNRYGSIDILVNCAAEQLQQPDASDIKDDQLVRTYRSMCIRV